MTKQPKVKILIGYHKPAKLFKSDILVPIHLGRALATQASKDGKISADDYQWMLDNMIGDDTGDNISKLNRYFAEITAIYWAWKNYNKLGNPEYIGLAHYRRIFKNQDIESASQYDITAVKDKVYYDKNIEEQFNNYHYTNDLYDAINVLKNIHPEYEKDINEYLQQSHGYFYNMFIMKKEIFFEYCELLFGILFKLYKNIDYNELTCCNQRMPAYVAERLTGIFIKHKKQSNTVNEVSAIFQDVGSNAPIKPIFKDAVCVCLSSDDNYAKYLGVTIASIKANKKAKDNYDICVLDGGISQLNKKKILKLCEKNFSIRFINITGFIDNIDEKIFSLNAHFTIATYFRFFIPQIFSEYKKVVYIDCDLVVNKDISELFNMNLGKYAIGAVRDVEMLRRLETDHRYNGNVPEYLKDTLKMKNPARYFQAGVLVLDIPKLSKANFTKKCIDKLIEIKEPLYVDQCVLNSLFDGEYKQIDMHWNVMWQLVIFCTDLDKQLDMKSYTEYMDSRNNPYIVHYAGGIKPWNNPEIDMADIWWKYARMTSFYEEFLHDFSTKPVAPYKRQRVYKLKMKVLTHEILAAVTFGNLHTRQKQSAKNYRNLIRDTKN